MTRSAPRIPVLCIDPGVANLGVAALDWTPQGPKVLASGYIETERDKSWGIAVDARRRIDGVMAFLDDWYGAFKPTRIVAEAFESHEATRASWEALQTLRVLGRIEEWAVQRGCTYEEIGTQSVKSRIKIGRSATKKQVQARVVTLTGCRLPDTEKRRSHIADAIAVGLAAGGTR